MIGPAPKKIYDDKIVRVKGNEWWRQGMYELALSSDASTEQKKAFEKDMNEWISPNSPLFPGMKRPYYTWTGKVVDKG